MLRRLRRVWGPAAVCVLLPWTGAGCMRQAMIDNQLEITREAAPAVNTLGDYEVARHVVYSSLGTLEGLRWVSPENPDALLLLVQTWSSAAFGFMEDAMQDAQDMGDEEEADYHRTRARAAYHRAIFYGVEGLEQVASGFEQATGSLPSMQAYLKSFDKKHVPLLFHTGSAWMGRVSTSADIGEVTSKAYVGLALLQRVVELDETYEQGMAHALLGAFYAQGPQAQPALAQQHFERALQINGGKYLMTQVLYAQTYWCQQKNGDRYIGLLEQVLDADDPLPAHRLSNLIAKRRAARGLGEARMGACGF